MNLLLTGNPFVDTGLGVLAALGGCKKINELNLDIMKKVHGNGEKLARRNSSLKSISMIFTINSISTNPGIKDKEKRVLYYSKITTALLDNIGNEDVNELCESCGNDKSLDLDKIIRNTLVPLGYEDDIRYVGRDWFPLAGSLKSDAQSLPACSRGPNICAKCLFAVHYLTHGVLLIGGRLSVFQSTNLSFWFGFIKNLVKDVDNRISAGDFNTLGAKDNTTAIKRLLLFMKDLKDEEINATLYLWKFSNSGTGADCKIEEIPNKALVFLHKVEREGFENELFDYLKKEKGGQSSLFNCILYGKDYWNLYPFKRFDGCSIRLFYLYQKIVRDVDETILNTSFKIAEYIKKTVDEKQFEKLGKDLEKDNDSKNKAKKFIVEMINERIITIDEFQNLLNLNSKNLDFGSSFESDSSLGKTFLPISYDSWKFIKYYMHNINKGLDYIGGREKIDNDNNELSEENNDSQLYDISNFISKLKYLAALIFDTYIADYGKDRFISSILLNYSRDIDISWLRRQFIKVAIENKYFNFQTWRDLFINSDGKEDGYDVLYFLRLLWTDWINKSNNKFDEHKNFLGLYDSSKLDLRQDGKSLSSLFEKPGFSSIYQLDKKYYDLIKTIIENYLANKGKNYVIKYILSDIKRGNITLMWYKSRLKINEDNWDALLYDDDKKNISNIRLFQMNLLSVEVYGEYVFKKDNKKKQNE